MNLFKTFHRSIADPAFYCENRPGVVRSSIIYLLKILALAIVLSAGAHTVYCIVSVQRVPRAIADLFDGIAIHEGELRCSHPMPYMPPGSRITSVLQAFLQVPDLPQVPLDSLLIIDTSAAAAANVGRHTSMVLSRRHVILYPGSALSRKILYEDILGEHGSFTFSIPEFHAILRRYAGHVFFMYLLIDSLRWLVDGAITFFFLILAVYILRFNRRECPVSVVPMVCYAASPVIGGQSIVALSGAVVKGTWHVFMVVSIVVLFRGFRACCARADGQQPG